jgi:hypothetical protein
MSLDQHIGEPYSLAGGIQQGCPISPLLFQLVVAARAGPDSTFACNSTRIT